MITTMQNKYDIQVDMGLLAEQDGCPISPAIQSYFDHYSLDWPEAEHRFGWFQSRGLRLAGHVWTPTKIKYQKSNIKNVESPEVTDSLGADAMVIVLHGYMNHTGQMRHVIAGLLEAGYSVGAFDLPGHGLSQGRQAAVGAFSDYTTALLDFVMATQSVCADKRHFAGFSTGAGVGIDLLLHTPAGDVFDKVVLAAPLVRWRGYTASKATYVFYRTFTDRIPRAPQKNSSDDDFLYFNRHEDYLHSRTMSLDWVGAVFDWNRQVEAATACDKEVLILQGNRDTTVDWRYNVRLLQAKFPAARVELIEGARHELFNESLEIRETCIMATLHYLLAVR